MGLELSKEYTLLRQIQFLPVAVTRKDPEVVIVLKFLSAIGKVRVKNRPRSPVVALHITGLGFIGSQHHAFGQARQKLVPLLLVEPFVPGVANGKQDRPLGG